MSHYIYNTEAIILRGFDVGESSRFINILTKDLGLIGAKAQGLRELKSKLRYSLQDFSHSQVNLVRGKDIWRITSASKKDSYDELFLDKSKILVFVEVLSFINRLIKGEEHSKDIFDLVLSSALFLAQNEFDEKNLIRLELIIKIRILYHLGYLDPGKEFLPFVEFSLWTMELVSGFEGQEDSARRAVETLLIESHL